MKSLLILLVVGVGAEGQRQRQGFRARGFVPPTQGQPIPEERYAAEYKGLEEHEHQRRDYRNGYGTWNDEEPVKATSQTKRKQVWEDEDYDNKELHHNDEYQSHNDETQIVTSAAHDRQHFRYPSFKPHPNQLKPFTTPIPILRLDKEQRLDGSYKTSYETGNSIIHEETGFMKEHGGPHEMLVQQGSYSYTDADGNEFTVRYTADENGFRAQGAHFPTPPPVPPEIQRGLDIIYEQIRLDAERRLSDKKFHDENEADDYNGEYSSQIEHKIPPQTNIRNQPAHQTNQDQIKNNFRTSQKQPIQHYNKHIQPNEQQILYNGNIQKDVRGVHGPSHHSSESYGHSDLRPPPPENPPYPRPTHIFRPQQSARLVKQFNEK